MMDTLPKEILQLIFDYMNYYDKLNWIYVSKKFNSIHLDKPFVLLSAPSYQWPQNASSPEYFITLNRLSDLIIQTQKKRTGLNDRIAMNGYYEYYVYMVIPNSLTRWSPKSHFDFTFLLLPEHIEWHKSWLDFWPERDNYNRKYYK